MTTVTFRNGTTVSDGSDEATTLRNGGHRTRFVPALVGTVEAAAEAKGWASLLGTVVYDSEYSAKEYAVGTTCPSGSAKSWAVGTGEVAGGLYSAKYYMEQAQTFSNSAINAPGTSATSTTSVTIGTGSKTFTIQTGKAFSVGQFVIVSDQTTPANYMVGQVTAHNSSTGSLVISVSSTGGSGTLANWIVSLTALANVAGAATLGGNNIYSGTNTYNAAVSMTGSLDVSGTTNFTGDTNLKGTTTVYKASGSVLLTAQTLSNISNDFASYSLKTGSNEVKINLEASTGAFSIQDATNSRDLLSYVPGTDKVVLRKPQRADAATSANDLVRKAELDNASVQSIVTTTQGALSGFRNRVINGDMRVAQRSTLTTGLAGTDFIQRGVIDCFYNRQYYLGQNAALTFYHSTTNNTVFTELRAQTAVSGYTGFTNTWAQTGIYFGIESDNIRDLVDTAFTISFKFRAAVAGTYSLVIHSTNKANPSCYVTTFNCSAAHTTEKITVTVPVDNLNTGGNYYPGGFFGSLGLKVSIGGVGGSSNQIAPSSLWRTPAAAGVEVASGCVNWSNTANNYIAITEVQLEKGSVATPFEQRPYQVELALCQRYYETGSMYGWGRADGAANARAGYVAFKVPKRPVSFTPSFSGMIYANSSGIAAEGISEGGFGFYVAAAAAGQINVNGVWSVSTEF